jgi:hypothetical protein
VAVSEEAVNEPYEREWPSLGCHALEESVFEQGIKGPLDVHGDHGNLVASCKGCFDVVGKAGDQVHR